MSLPQLYLEGLTQRAMLGPDRLNAYKLGVIEAILKDALRVDADLDPAPLRAAVRTAVDVAVWEMPRSRPPAPDAEPDPQAW